MALSLLIAQSPIETLHIETLHTREAEAGICIEESLTTVMVELRKNLHFTGTNVEREVAGDLVMRGSLQVSVLPSYINGLEIQEPDYGCWRVRWPTKNQQGGDFCCILELFWVLGKCCCAGGAYVVLSELINEIIT